jgi:DNA-binding response OmpR family regulator
MLGTLLLAEDDELMCMVTREILEECGYVVETAKDGLAAWEKMDSPPSCFDLILLDKKMPRLDGISLLKRIKADARFKELPVIMLTGDDRQQDIIEGLAEGAYYYLTKPPAAEILKLVIKNALNECLQKRELRALLGQKKTNLNLIHRAEFHYRNLSEARDLALLLAEASMDPGRTLNGYLELLINAVEHGNLSISYAEKSTLVNEGRWAEEVETRLQHPDFADRRVNVTLEKTANTNYVKITDQGIGFDWNAYIEFNPARVFDLHGRGIAMSKAISFDSLEYLGKGNSVVTTVLRPRPK